MASDFALLGFEVEVTAMPEDEEIPVWHENWASVVAFMACETQWRVKATMGGLIWIGLDYAGVKVLLDAEGLGNDIFRDLRIMEAAALPKLNEDAD